VNRSQAHEYYKQQVNEIAAMRPITDGQYLAVVQAYDAAVAAGETDKLPGLASAAAAASNARLEHEIAWSEACANVIATKGLFGQKGRAAQMRREDLPLIQAAKDELAMWEARSRELGPPASATA
jgi:hypothetical protein